MFNVVCCWTGPKNADDWPKRSTKFSKIYVDRLYAGVKRNIDIEFEFWVMTDRPDQFPEDGPIKTIPYEGKSNQGWWSKPYLFSHHFEGPVLYLDIDVVVINNITNFVITCMKQNHMVMCQDPNTNWGNSSIMFWNGYAKYKFIYDNYAHSRAYWKDKFERVTLGSYGDQAYICFQLPEEPITLRDLGLEQWWCDSQITYNPKRDDAEFLILAGGHQKPHTMHHKVNYREHVSELVAKHWID
jgi:hypothetical protein